MMAKDGFASPCDSEGPTRVSSVVNLASLGGKLDAGKLTRKLSGLAAPQPTYSVEDAGETKTLEFRRFLTADGKQISAWHDVPLRGPRGGYHVVVEITKNTTAKMEIATDEQLAPIKQDTKKG